MQLAKAMKIPSETTMRRTAAALAPMACVTPNSRVRSSTLVLIVEASLTHPTTPIAMAIAKKITTIGSMWPVPAASKRLTDAEDRTRIGASVSTRSAALATAARVSSSWPSVTMRRTLGWFAPEASAKPSAVYAGHPRDAAHPFPALYPRQLAAGLVGIGGLPRPARWSACGWATRPFLCGSSRSPTGAQRRPRPGVRRRPPACAPAAQPLVGLGDDGGTDPGSDGEFAAGKVTRSIRSASR